MMFSFKKTLIFIVISKICFSSENNKYMYNDEIIDLNFTLPQQNKILPFPQVQLITNIINSNQLNYKHCSQNVKEVVIEVAKMSMYKKRFSLFPNNQLFQNIIINFLQSEDLIKLFAAFKNKNITFQHLFPKQFQSKIVLNLNGGFLKLFTFYPDFKNLIPILYQKEQNIHKMSSVVMKPNNENFFNIKKSFFYTSGKLISFQFSHSLNNEQTALLGIYNHTKFVLAVKTNENFISILCDGEFLTQEKRTSTSIILNFPDGLDFAFPKDISILLNAKNESKRFLFKLSYGYLNFISHYYQKIVSIFPFFEKCCVREGSYFHEIFRILAYMSFVLCLVIIGYPFAFAFPLYFETHIFFLPFLWNQPNLIYYTSIFAAMFAPTHLEHFSVALKIHAKPKTTVWLLAKHHANHKFNFFVFLVVYANLCAFLFLYTVLNVSPFVNFLQNLFIAE